MRSIKEKWLSFISGSGCRPSGQTYPAVICDNANRYDPTKNLNIPNWVTGAVGGAVANARGGLVGIGIGAVGGAIGGGILNKDKNDNDDKNRQ
jgi:outer membrane lipoprotein SlyB